MQIGPRIRVGGTLGHVGQQAKVGAGKVLSNKFVDAGLSLIPGVGPGIAAAANAAGHVLDTSGGGIHSLRDVGNVALDAGKVYGTGKLLNSAAGKLGSLGNASSAAPDAIAPTTGLPIPADANLTGAHIPTGADFGYSTPHSALGGIGDKIGKVATFAGNHDKVTGALLNAGGDFLLGGSARRAQDTEAEIERQRLLEEKYNFQRRKQNDAASGPAWSALGTALGSGLTNAMTNPYLPKVGG